MRGAANFLPHARVTTHKLNKAVHAAHRGIVFPIQREIFGASGAVTIYAQSKVTIPRLRFEGTDHAGGDGSGAATAVERPHRTVNFAFAVRMGISISQRTPSA